jgi:hypothetical protein
MGIKIKQRHLQLLAQHIGIILFFASLYFITHITIPNAFKSTIDTNRQLTFLDFIYYSLVTQTTVGYGDIVPVHVLPRIINMIQMLTIFSVILVWLI